MNRYNVVLLQPPNFPYVMALWDICRLLHHSFQSLGAASSLQINTLDSSAVNVILGYHLLRNPLIMDQQPCIIYQLEQLSDHEGWFSPARLEILKRAREIWDYSPENIAFLQSKGLRNLRLLPIGFHEKLHTIPSVEQDIDVLFYGTLNERRQEVLDQLKKQCRLETLVCVYGEDRDALIARSKIILNIHFYETCIMEQARISYLLNNGCCVVSETSPVNPFEGMISTAPREQLPELCLRLLQNPDERQKISLRGLEQFRRRPMTDYLQPVIHDFEHTARDKGPVMPQSPSPRRHTANPLNLAKAADYYEHARPEVIALLKQQALVAPAVLELGCSTGAFCAKFKEAFNGTRYVGIELSQDAAKKASARLDQVHVANIETVSPQELGLATGQFDLLVALDLLEHLVNPWDTLATWVELLKPGGLVVVSIPNVQNIEVIRGLIAGKWEYVGAGLLDVTHLRFFTRQGIEQLLLGAGLKIVRTEVVLSQKLDLAGIQETGNAINFDNASLANLTRDQIIQLLTYQYLVLGQKPG